MDKLRLIISYPLKNSKTKRFKDDAYFKTPIKKVFARLVCLSFVYVNCIQITIVQCLKTSCVSKLLNCA